MDPPHPIWLTGRATTQLGADTATWGSESDVTDMPTGIIPLGKRLPSPTNVHRTGADAGLDELVASIFVQTQGCRSEPTAVGWPALQQASYGTRRR